MIASPPRSFPSERADEGPSELLRQRHDLASVVTLALHQNFLQSKRGVVPWSVKKPVVE